MKVLILGESWLTVQIHIKGFDHFVDSTYAEGVEPLRAALQAQGIDVDYIPNHSASVAAPTTLEQLTAYDVVILSDIGANTLLLHPDTFAQFKRTPNRVKLLAEWVRGGGGLCMVGGYLTFQGIEAKGCWKHTAVEEVLPVTLMETDDRVETPEGVVPTVVNTTHPIMEGVAPTVPHFLGYNRLRARADADLLWAVGDDAFLSARQVGSGRTVAFASDCAPHWGSPEFMAWESYALLWGNMCRWLSGK